MGVERRTHASILGTTQWRYFTPLAKPNVVDLTEIDYQADFTTGSFRSTAVLGLPIFIGRCHIDNTIRRPTAGSIVEERVKFE